MDGVFPDTLLNAHGQSVGFKRVDGEVVGDVTRDRNGRDHLLPEPPGGGYTDQFDINDRGHVVASLRNPQDFESHGFALWARRQVNRIDLGQRINVIGLNNSDQVLIRQLDSGIPALWDAQNGLTEIAWPDDRYQVLTGDAMSDEGVITGRARRGRRNFAYVLDESGFRLISPPAGGIKMEPRFVNNAGDVIGLTTFEVGGGYETFFAAAGETTASRLDALITNLSGWTDLDIVGMNNRGQILGNGTLNGEQKPFVLNRVAQLSPVPEPVALLWCVGLALAVSNRQR